jgi:hypothetical protein
MTTLLEQIADVLPGCGASGREERGLARASSPTNDVATGPVRLQRRADSAQIVARPSALLTHALWPICLVKWGVTRLHILLFTREG